MYYGTPYNTHAEIGISLDMMGEWGWEVEHWFPPEDNAEDNPSDKKYFQGFILRKPDRKKISF